MKKTSLLAVFTLAAILSSISVSYTAPKPYNNEKVSIVVAVFPQLDVAFSAFLPDFQAKYPNISVEIKKLGYNDHHNNLITVIAAGQGAPDVAAIDYVYVSELGAGGGFDNLLKAPYNAGEFKKDEPGYSWAQGSTSPTELFAFPVDIGPATAFLYKPTWDLKKINYEKSIKTMDDLLNAGKKLTFDSQKDGKVDHWLVSHAYLIFKMIFFSDKQRYFDKSGQPALDTPRIRNAFMWAKKFRDAGLDAKLNDWSNEWFAMWASGTAAFIPGGAWTTSYLEEQWAPDQKGNYRIGLLPALAKGEKPMMMSDGGTFLTIPSQIPDVNKSAAWEFIKFAATQVKSQLAAFDKAHDFPSYKPSWTDPSMSTGVSFLGGQKAKLIWIEVAKAIPEVYVNPKDSIAAGVIASAVYDYLDGKKDLNTALATAQKDLTTKMSQ